MNEKELKKYLEERDISEQQFRIDMLKMINKLNTLQLFNVYTQAMRNNPKFMANLLIETGLGIKLINGIPSVDWEYFESIDSGITEKVKKQLLKKKKVEQSK